MFCFFVFFIILIIVRNILTVILLFNVYGSVEHSGGQRVRLDVQRLKQFSVFPGQVRKKKA